MTRLKITNSQIFARDDVKLSHNVRFRSLTNDSATSSLRHLSMFSR